MLGGTMDQLTRRNFLTVAGAGASLVAAGSVSQALTSSPTELPAGASGAIVAHVSDVRSDEVVLFVGEQEVIVHDADLVARLARAAR
jgi:hypothetical protein